MIYIIKKILFLISILIAVSGICQEKDVLDKLDHKDSLRSIKAENIYSKSVVTREVRNAFFRNIYRAKNNNEEAEFQKQIDLLMPFDGKKIDSIIYLKFEIMGENIYDTFQKGNKFEHFVSTTLHSNTKTKVLENRFMLFKIGDVFNPYKALENARLIRSSGIFHDVRFLPLIIENDSNHIHLFVYVQDVFPYGFSFSPSDVNRYGFGISNVNIAGLGHQIHTDFKINTKDPVKPFGYGFSYIIPSVLKKQFIDFRTSYRNYSKYEDVELNISRQFSRPEFRWAGGYQTNFTNRMSPLSNNTEVVIKSYSNQLWYSRSFPFRERDVTINAFVIGVKLSRLDFIERPEVSSNTFYTFWNRNQVLGSLGYSKIKYIQDRLLNGFGRTEDIPKGISFNVLYGYDFTEFGTRTYYGMQLLTQYYNKSGAYINFGGKAGTFSFKNNPNQGVVDLNLQSASPLIKMGNFRLRNYLNSRMTLGINNDPSEFITFNDYNGIRGINNASFKGNLRTTFNFQSSLFIPTSVLGFRFSIFGILELAKMNKSNEKYFDTPLNSGFSMGIAIKNENLIFDVIQIQYGFYPSTQNLNNRGFLISSIIPFSFQSLDISKPNVVEFR